MRVKAKVDERIRLLTSIACLALTVTLIAMLGDGPLGIVILILSIVVIEFSRWVLFRVHYELQDEYLVIRRGPFVEKLAYKDIKLLSLVQNRHLFKLLSAERIEIKQDGQGSVSGAMSIAPENREVFMGELAMRCMNLA